MIPSWPSLVLTFLGGSLSATLIKIWWDLYQAKKRPVTYRISTSSILNPKKLFSGLRAELNLYTEEGASIRSFPNLFLVILNVKNSSNKDFDTYEFGITLDGSETIVKAVGEGKSRHHRVMASPTIDFDSTSDVVDFKLAPFNKKDVATIWLYITPSVSSDVPLDRDDIKVSTADSAGIKKAEEGDDNTWGRKIGGAFVLLSMYALIILTFGWCSKRDMEHRIDLHKIQKSDTLLMREREKSKLLFDSLKSLIDSLKNPQRLTPVHQPKQ